jgi:FSR family fosmidomycin resistance protein-like MFS transporter
MRALTLIKRPDFRRALRGPAVFAMTLLVVEFLDELVFGVREAAWPLIRDELSLTYAQVGLLLGLPNLFASLIEPVLGVLGDVWKRWVLITLGGLLFGLTLILAGGSYSFGLLLLAFALMYPASGALVGLAQATLMDLDPNRHEHLMARWTLAGSVGVVAGPLLLSAGLFVGLGWRGLLIGLGGLTLAVTWLVWRQPRLRANGHATREDGAPLGLRAGLRQAVSALRQRAVLRWLVLLEFSDFMLDVLLGFLALYFVDVVGVSPALAGTAVAVWSGAGLLSDALIIPVLERVRGLSYLRVSALVMLLLFPAFMVVPGFGPKLVVLALMGLANAGWYAILQGQLYTALPGQSGTAMAVNSAFGLVTGAVPAVLGWVAQQAGLPITMWLLLLGPIALLIGLPRRQPSAGPVSK